jgi:hypothetical protein
MCPGMRFWRRTTYEVGTRGPARERMSGPLPRDMLVSLLVEAAAGTSVHSPRVGGRCVRTGGPGSNERGPTARGALVLTQCLGATVGTLDHYP